MAGSYFDGRSAVRQSVQVRVVGEGLILTQADGSVVQWPFHSYRLQRSPGDRFLRFERAPYRGECVLVEDPEEVARLLRHLRQREHSGGRSKRVAVWLLLAPVLLWRGRNICALYILYTWL